MLSGSTSGGNSLGGNSVARIVEENCPGMLASAGVVVEQLDAQAGTWQFSTDEGQTWRPIRTDLINRPGNLGLALDRDARLRVLPFSGHRVNGARVAFHTVQRSHGPGNGSYRPYAGDDREDGSRTVTLVMPLPWPSSRLATLTAGVWLVYGEVVLLLGMARIRSGRYAGGARLPTESELSALHGLSRQTVRRAFQDLVADGMVYRVPGRGTYAGGDRRRYLRSLGSIDDLMSLSDDTTMEVLDGLRRRVDIDAASRLRLDGDVVHTVVFRRLHDGIPFGHTVVHLPPEVASMVTASADLRTGARSRHTVIGLLEPYLRSSQIACYFEDLQRADLVQRSESGGWLLSRSLDSTDLLRVYSGTQYRLPLRPADEARSLGIVLPPVLIDLLAAMAETLETALGTRLDRIYPPSADAPDASEELVP